MGTEPLISDELAGYLASGISVTVATRDGELQPDGARAWAVCVHDDRAHLTVFLYEKAASAMLRNLEERCPEIRIVQSGRGRFRLELRGEVALAERP